MDSSKKRSPDYTDIAYREAVARLRYLLAESYSPQATPTKIPHVRSNKPEDSGDETDASMAVSDRSRPRHHHHVHPPPSPYRSPYFGAKRSLYTDIVPKTTQLTSTLQVPKIVDGAGSAVTNSKTDGQQPPPELMAFIERQEDYIEQLEKESQYCREELTNLLSKVKDIISENEGLHEKEKSGILKSVFEYLTSGGEEEEEDDDEDEVEEKRDRKKSPTKKKRLEGPSIVFESRISELEAQLTQTKIELRKAQEEAEMLKKKYGGLEPGSVMDSATSPGIESYKKQIDALQREKEELADNLAKLSSAVSHMRDKEADASQKVKRSFDMVDQAQFEKAQAELEVRRLKDELERQHEKLRDLLQEQGRRVQDERTQAERRYAQQVEQLTCDLSAQWDTAGKLQLELEKQRRTESELRRELQQKSAIIEELKKELQTKIAGLQSEATQSAAERGSLEQELAASRLVTERAEREARQESARLQAEITALRQRLDRADADLLHSRRENLRLSEQIASLERELNLAKMMKESSDKPSGEGPSSNTSREKELTSMIMNMEAKHVQTVGELESMIQTQTDLMEKLKDECRSLTQKLEESSARHKEEMAGLQSNVGYLSSKLEAFEAQDWRDDNYVEGNERGPEHGFALDQQYEQQPQYEAQPAFESQSEYEPQPGYETQQPGAYPQHEQEYAPQSTFQSQPEYSQHEQEYAPQSTYQSEPEYKQHEQEYAAQQPTYQSQPEYNQREQEFAQQSTYQPQSEYDQHEQEYQQQPTNESKPEYQPSEQYQSQPNYGAKSSYGSDSDYSAKTEQQQPSYEQQPEYTSQSDYSGSQAQYQAPEPQYQPQTQQSYQQGSPAREFYPEAPRTQQAFRKQSSSEQVPPSPRRSRPVSRQGSGSDQLPPVSPSTPQRFFRQGSSELPPRSPSRAAIASKKQSSTELQQSYTPASNYQTQHGIEPTPHPYTEQFGAYDDRQSTEYIAETQPQLSRQPSAESHIATRPPSVEPQWQGPGSNMSPQGPPPPQP
ncbi:hypothetical protein R5R35_006583 [Gryllus longicercus]